jgi:hypothetical protein
MFGWGNGNGLLPAGWRRTAAWILVTIAIIFWLWFGIGSAIVVEGTAFDWLMYLLFPGGFFILSALIARRWQRVGGGVLIFLGSMALIVTVLGHLRGSNSVTTTILMFLTLALPPLASGILFLLDALEAKREKSQDG